VGVGVGVGVGVCAGGQPWVIVKVPASPVNVTNVVAWSGSSSSHGDTNFQDDEPPPDWTHDPACA
jgi:hypothetical protein